ARLRIAGRLLLEGPEVAAALLRVLVLRILGHDILELLLIGRGRRRGLGQGFRFGVSLVGLSLVLGRHLAHPHLVLLIELGGMLVVILDRKSTRLNSS